MEPGDFGLYFCPNLSRLYLGGPSGRSAGWYLYACPGFLAPDAVLRVATFPPSPRFELVGFNGPWPCFGGVTFLMSDS